MKRTYQNFNTFILDLILESYDMVEKTYEESVKMNLIPKLPENFNDIYNIIFYEDTYSFNNIEITPANQETKYIDLEKGYEEIAFTVKITGLKNIIFYNIETLYSPQLDWEDSLDEYCNIYEVYPRNNNNI